MGLSMHSNSHLGVSLMAMTHVAAASPHLTFACDTHYPWQTEKDEVVAGGRGRFSGGAGGISVKPGPGGGFLSHHLPRRRGRCPKIPYPNREHWAGNRHPLDA